MRQCKTDFKTVGFLKISKEIGKAWSKSLTRVKREKKVFLKYLPSLTLCFQPRSLFDCSHVLENAKIWTVLQSMKDTSRFEGNKINFFSHITGARNELKLHKKYINASHNMGQVKFHKDSQDCYWRQREYNWPIADWRISSNDSRSLCTS